MHACVHTCMFSAGANERPNEPLTTPYVLLKLADTWTVSTSLIEYTQFLDRLLRAVTFLGAATDSNSNNGDATAGVAPPSPTAAVVDGGGVAGRIPPPLPPASPSNRLASTLARLARPMGDDNGEATVGRRRRGARGVRHGGDSDDSGHPSASSPICISSPSGGVVRKSHFFSSSAPARKQVLFTSYEPKYIPDDW
jgi:hypothetical protein